MEMDLSIPVQSREPEKSWFGRNWLWFVPVVILLPVMCCCGGGGMLAWWGLGQMQNLPPYVDSVAAAEQDPAVQQALGTPVSVPTVFGFPNGGTFNLKTDNAGTQFVAKLPLDGSAASGTLHVEANSLDNLNWTYTVREVVLNDASGTVIDLLPTGKGSPAKQNTPAKDAQPDKDGDSAPPVKSP